MTKLEIMFIALFAAMLLLLCMLGSPVYNRLPKELNNHKILFVTPTATIDTSLHVILGATNDIDR